VLLLLLGLSHGAPLCTGRTAHALDELRPTLAVGLDRSGLDHKSAGMALLTTFCRRCAQVALSDQQHLLNGRLPCESCGDNVLVAPGYSFSEDDRELFEDLKQVVDDRTIEAEEAKQIATHIGSVLRSGVDHDLLERLTNRLPGLLPIQTAAGTNRPARQRALRLLRAIFEAMALGKASR